MSQSFIPLAFVAGLTALAASVPALTDASEPSAEYAAEYDAYAAQDFRHFERACAAGGPERQAFAALIEDEAPSALTKCDRAQFATAARIAFDNAGDAFWRNPDTRRRGVVRAGAPIEGYAHDCRRAEIQVFETGGGYFTRTRTVCRDQAGAWIPAG